MAALRNGGSAIDGVEIALRSLEDNEITNAGYGSNLALDGSVECDASIMEESGRSGAVGAVESEHSLHIPAHVGVAKDFYRLQEPLSTRPVDPGQLASPNVTQACTPHPGRRPRSTDVRQHLQLPNHQEPRTHLAECVFEMVQVEARAGQYR